MGGNNTKINIQHKIWPRANSHEIYSNIFFRTMSLISYDIGEYLSFGKTDLETIRDRFNNEFDLIEKNQGFVDGKRQTYDTSDTCCFIKENYFIKENIIHSCNPTTYTFNSNTCDTALYNLCIVSKGTNFKCEPWIRSVVQRKISLFDNVLEFCSKEENRNHNFTKIFLTSLRDFDNDNNYNQIADNILNSYSIDIRNTEYKCAFSNNEVNNIQLTNPILIKECWYKECVLSPVFKLLTENIIRRQLCKITICDINIHELNISNNEVEIICNNKFDKTTIDVKSLPFRIDQDQLFYIPAFNNTILPLLVVLSILFIKI